MKLNRNILVSIIITTFLLSALVYNLLYINNKKNEIIQEVSEEENFEEEEIIKEEEKIIYVHIAGAVNNPGLYALPEGARVNDLVIEAGGLLDEADLTEINLAYILNDATKVTIPKKGEGIKKDSIISNKISYISGNTSKSNTLGKININTATVSELNTLTGIGEATANKIIEYRNNNNGFKSIEELKNVSGIGDLKYAKIKDHITI